MQQQGCTERGVRAHKVCGRESVGEGRGLGQEGSSPGDIEVGLKPLVGKGG